jgi:hypothetical protein
MPSGWAAGVWAGFAWGGPSVATAKGARGTVALTDFSALAVLCDMAPSATLVDMGNGSALTMSLAPTVQLRDLSPSIVTSDSG